jgi:hypothetical protein
MQALAAAAGYCSGCVAQQHGGSAKIPGQDISCLRKAVREQHHLTALLLHSTVKSVGSHGDAPHRWAHATGIQQGSLHPGITRAQAPSGRSTPHMHSQPAGESLHGQQLSMSARIAKALHSRLWAGGTFDLADSDAAADACQDSGQCLRAAVSSCCVRECVKAQRSSARAWPQIMPNGVAHLLRTYGAAFSAQCTRCLPLEAAGPAADCHALYAFAAAPW